MHIAAIYNDNDTAKMITWLVVEMGAALEPKEKTFGRTPLHLAAERGHRAVVEFLFRHDANIDAVDDSGNTPMHLAAAFGREEVVKVLLSSRRGGIRLLEVNKLSESLDYNEKFP